MDKQSLKSRFGVIGNSPALNRAIDIAMQVAITDMSILITGESGTGKEVFSKIIHQLSPRKHKKLIAVNCGAIPEGTIESELFGHVKGSFTNAEKDRKGYFEEANGGTIFLDEVAELPLPMQAKLLRVLETGEMIKVGSSKVEKVDVRIVSATNVDIPQAISKGKFREDLYYRLNQISIHIPPLRERKDDIYLLFIKFASEIAEKYRMPVIELSPDAREYFINYCWDGNVRELKNITEQISIIERDRYITKEVLLRYIPDHSKEKLPVLYAENNTEKGISDRELLLKALNMGQMINELRSEVNDLKNVLSSYSPVNTPIGYVSNNEDLLAQKTIAPAQNPSNYTPNIGSFQRIEEANDFEDMQIIEDETLQFEELEKMAIKKALEKHHGKRKDAANELGISERTLYRKLKEYGF